MRRRLAAVSGMRTASSWSQALAEARTWLTGQMPQMRAVSAGISKYGRPTTNCSNPRTWVTWNRASATRPASSSSREMRAWPSIRVTGSMTIRSAMVFLLGAETGGERQLGHPPLAQGDEQLMDAVGRRRTARHEQVHGHDRVQRPGLLV